MSDLLLALITLGALIIAGVIAYNWIQERKLRKNITEEFIVPQKDVLTEDFYIDTNAYLDNALTESPNKTKLTEKLNTPEPTQGAQVDEVSDILTEQSKSYSSSPQYAANIGFDEAFANERAPEPEPPPAKIEALVSALPADTHPQIDLTAFLFATKDFSGQQLNKQANDIASDMGVPMQLHGLDANGKWHDINQKTQEEGFKQIACSIQLADRGGPISKHKLNKFQFAIENMGLEIGAHVEWQGAGDAMQRAIELDKFCMEVDQIISVHLIETDTPIHGTKLKGLAEVGGLKLLDDGKFHFAAEHQTEVVSFTLARSNGQPFTADSLRAEAVKSAVFQMEIPKASNSEHAFIQMVQIAKKIAGSLGAQLVDDHQKPLGDLQIEKIRQQLKVIHATMVARGIMPGSASAARLFN